MKYHATTDKKIAIWETNFSKHKSSNKIELQTKNALVWLVRVSFSCQYEEAPDVLCSSIVVSSVQTISPKAMNPSRQDLINTCDIAAFSGCYSEIQIKLNGRACLIGSLFRATKCAVWSHIPIVSYMGPFCVFSNMWAPLWIIAGKIEWSAAMFLNVPYNFIHFMSLRMIAIKVISIS